MKEKLKILSVILTASIAYCVILGLIFASNKHIPADSDKVSDCAQLPIIMYHSVLKDTDLSGKFTVTPDTVSRDITYLKNNGYSFISLGELLEYVYNGAPLPEKPVMLTFDDGFYNNLGYVLPILKKYDAKAVIAVVGKYTDDYTQSNVANLTYGYLRWSDIYELIESGRIDIANHSYNFHSNTNGRNGSKRKRYEDKAAYKQIFVKDTEKAQQCFSDHTGYTPIAYTYPFGAYSEETTKYLKDMGFKMSFSCNEGINLITNNPDCLFLLKRYNRPYGINTEDYFKRILKSKD